MEDLLNLYELITDTVAPNLVIPKVTTPDGEVNPAYTKWKRQNWLILSWIKSSIW